MLLDSVLLPVNNVLNRIHESEMVLERPKFLNPPESLHQIWDTIKGCRTFSTKTGVLKNYRMWNQWFTVSIDAMHHSGRQF
jgi:hypothetical protein